MFLFVSKPHESARTIKLVQLDPSIIPVRLDRDLIPIQKPSDLSSDYSVSMVTQLGTRPWRRALLDDLYTPDTNALYLLGFLW